MNTLRKKGSRGPVEADRTIGARVRARRAALGLSQKEIAEALGVTFQQVQKYESGSNRISAFAMYRLTNFLGIPIEAVFDGLDPSVTPYSQTNPDAFAAAEATSHYKVEDRDFQRDADELITLLRAMQAPQRRAAIDFISRMIEK